MIKRILNLLKILISAGLLVWIFLYQVDLPILWQTLQQARWLPVGAAAVLIISGTVLRALRWQILLKSLNLQVSFTRLAQLYFQGAFFSMFLPTGFGGDAVKMAKLAQTTGQLPESIGTTLVERATGLWVSFFLALVALPFSVNLLPAGWLQAIAAITLGGVVGGFLIMATPLLPWLGSKVHLPGQATLERFYRSVAQLGWRALLGASLVSLGFNILLILFNYCIALAFDLDLPISLFVLFTPLISFSLALPISIGGLGVREQTYVTLFAAANVPAAQAVAMSLINYFLTYLVIGAIGGVLYIYENARNVTTAAIPQPDPLDQTPHT